MAPVKVFWTRRAREQLKKEGKIVGNFFFHTRGKVLIIGGPIEIHSDLATKLENRTGLRFYHNDYVTGWLGEGVVGVEGLLWKPHIQALSRALKKAGVKNLSVVTRPQLSEFTEKSFIERGRLFDLARRRLEV